MKNFCDDEDLHSKILVLEKKLFTFFNSCCIIPNSMKRIRTVPILFLLQNILYASSTVELSPRELWYDAHNQEIEYKIVNNDSRKIKSIKIIIPTGFICVSSQTQIEEISSNKSWTIIGFSGNELSLNAQIPSNYLATGEYLTLKIVVDTQEEPLPATSWSCQVTYDTSAQEPANEKSPGSSKVSIISLALNAEPKSLALVPNTTSEITVTLSDDNGSPLNNKNISVVIISGDADILTSTTTNSEGKAIFPVQIANTTVFRFIYNNPKRMKDATIFSIIDIPVPTPQNGFCSGSKIFSRDNTPVVIENKYEDYGVQTEYKIDDESWKVYIDTEPLYFNYRKAEPYNLGCRYIDAQGSRSSETPWVVYSTYAGSETVSKLINHPNPFSAGSESTAIEYVLEENSDVIISIYDLFGNVLLKREFSAGETYATKGPNCFLWNGRNDSDKIVANGGYICKLKIKQIGNSKTLTRKIGVRK
ncbi:MAG: hypothetical protein V1833_04225 [Elusimicrobiota bacterium]